MTEVELTLHASHSFFTELLTFMPLFCPNTADVTPAIRSSELTGRIDWLKSLVERVGAW